MNNRKELLKVLEDMPEEAFGWFVGWASGLMMQYPDGLGGFQDNSRESINKLRKVANKYIEEFKSEEFL